MARAKLAHRLLSKVDVSATGCWIWTGALADNGYGRLRIGPRAIGRHAYAHRIAYELLVGPIPVDLCIDHRCHNIDPSCSGGPDCLHRRCVNPLHLEVVTSAENTLRGKGPSAISARKTHCPKGHPYAGENLYVNPGGERQCRTCRREQVARGRAEGRYA